jgi:hypothetical protein
MEYKTKTDCKNRVANALKNILDTLDGNMKFTEIEVAMSSKDDKVILMDDISQLNDSLHSFFGRNDFTISISANQYREDLYPNEIEIKLNFR